MFTVLSIASGLFTKWKSAILVIGALLLVGYVWMITNSLVSVRDELDIEKQETAKLELINQEHNRQIQELIAQNELERDLSEKLNHQSFFTKQQLTTKIALLKKEAKTNATQNQCVNSAMPDYVIRMLNDTKGANRNPNQDSEIKPTS